MNDSLRGFILPLVLVFMHLITLVVIASSFNLLRNVKSANDFWQKKQMELMANLILKRLENSLAMETDYCMRDVIESANLVKKPVSWWERPGCFGTFQDINYFFTTEKLGEEECGFIPLINLPQTVNFYRISLFVSKKLQNRLYLQSTVARLAGKNKPCTNTLHKITLGRMMLREL